MLLGPSEAGRSYALINAGLVGGCIVKCSLFAEPFAFIQRAPDFGAESSRLIRSVSALVGL